MKTLLAKEWLNKTVTFLAISLILISCGTRKVNLSKVTDKSDSIIIENTYSQNSKTILMNKFTYTPFDNLRPMVIEGREYNNAIVSNDKSKINTISKIIYNRQTITTRLKLNETKQTAKTDNTVTYIGLFFILVLFVFLWFYLPKINLKYFN